MNDKIKLFNEQAIKYARESLNDIAIVNKSGIMYNYNDLYTEKFAELIVRECIEINKQELAFNAFELLMNKYQERFGVAE